LPEIAEKVMVPSEERSAQKIDRPPAVLTKTGSETMASEGAIKAAEALMSEHRDGVKFWPFASAFEIGDLDAAYAVQREHVRLQMQKLGGAVGYKIGLTSPRMQAMCGIDRPIAGVILEERVHQSGARLRASAYGRLGLEFEIAVRMARDLRPSAGRIDLSEVAAAVDAVCPAMEIVDDRGADYATLDVLSLVADNSWNAGVALGAFSAVWPDLTAIEGVVSSNGDVVDRGFGRDVLGHPFHSVAWLAEHLANAGDVLRAGDIVMTGNLVTTKFPAASSTYRFEAMGRGAVEVSVDA
jgi:2-keto-4-pentenoate hydratase